MPVLLALFAASFQPVLLHRLSTVLLELTTVRISSSSDHLFSSPEPLSPIPRSSSPEHLPEISPIIVCQTELESVVADVNLPTSWIIQTGSDHAALCKVSEPASRKTLVITLCVMVKSDMSWALSVHGHEINTHHESYQFLSSIPQVLNQQSLQELVLLLDKCSVCPGNPDGQYVSMVEEKRGQLKSKDRKSVIAKVDDFSSVTLNGKTYSKTVRVLNYDLLVSQGKCKSCRNSLRSIYHRWNKKMHFTI